MKGYYFITDSNLSKRGNVEDVEIALANGVEIIQYREKGKIKFDEVLKIKELCNKHNAKLIINDDIDLAKKADCDGVHLGQSDTDYKQARLVLGKDKIIGISTHNIDQAKQAQSCGADYIGYGPIFKTSTKPDAISPIGTDEIVKIKKEIKIPIVAIGGINLDNMDTVINLGIDMVCAISIVVANEEPVNIIKKIQSKFAL